MLFGGGGSSSSKRRFTPLMLEEKDYYFEDCAAFFHPTQKNVYVSINERIAMKGRLHVCSRNLLFEPDEHSPILRIPLRKVVSLAPRFAQKGQGYLVLRTKAVVEITAANTPYNFKNLDLVSAESEFSFSLMYVSLEKFMELLTQLYHLERENGNSGSSDNAGGGGPSLLETIITKRENSCHFDTTNYADLRERSMLPEQKSVLCSRVTPLLVTPGCLMVTDERIYFQPFSTVSAEPCYQYEINTITRLYKRRHMMRDVAIELYFPSSNRMNRNKGLASEESVFLVLKNTQTRNLVCDLLLTKKPLETPTAELNFRQQEWRTGKMSTFDYLMFLNQVAGRSFQDITQYPVFPWVISDFQSEQLDLANPSSYRDLSKPVGALNSERLANFKARMREMPQEIEGGPFLYGTHFSTPGYVLYFLVREVPEYMQRLQNGRFDHPDRLFTSIQSAWFSCLSAPTDVKELIPEFFWTEGEGRFLLNNAGLDLGQKQSGQEVDHVELPPWAKSARDFVKQMRAALEGEYVSKHIHQWIDLVFGYKQKGQAAVQADNVFFHLTYEGAVDLDQITDPKERESLQTQISEFGQMPKIIFSSPHPPRFSQSSAVDPSPRLKQQSSSSLSTTTAAVNDANTSVSRLSSSTSSAVASSSGDVSESFSSNPTLFFSASTALSSPPSPSISPTASARGDSLRASAASSPAWSLLSSVAPSPSLAPLSLSTTNSIPLTSSFFDLSARSNSASPILSSTNPFISVPSSSAASSVDFSDEGIAAAVAAASPSLSSAVAPLSATASSASSPSSPSYSAATTAATLAELESALALLSDLSLPSSVLSEEEEMSSLLTISSSSSSSSSPSDLDSSIFSFPFTPAAVGSVSFLYNNTPDTQPQQQVVFEEFSEQKSSFSPPLHKSISLNELANIEVQMLESTEVPELTVHIASLEPLSPRKWPLFTHQPTQVVNMHRAPVTAVVVVPEIVYSVSTDSCFKIYSLSEMRQKRSTTICELSLSCLATDGQSVLLGSWDDRIYLYSTSYGRVMSSVLAHDDAVSKIAMADRKVLSGSWDSSIKLWQLRESDMAPLFELSDHATEVRSLVITPDANVAVSGAEDGSVIMWDLRQKNSIVEFRGRGVTTDLCFTRAGVLACSSLGHLTLYETGSEREIWSVATDQSFTCMKSNDQTVIAGSTQGQLGMWDIRTSGCVSKLMTGGPLTCLDVSPDCRTLVTGFKASKDNLKVYEYKE